MFLLCIQIPITKIDVYAVLVRLACKEVLISGEMYATRVARQVAVDDDVASCGNVSLTAKDILVDCLLEAATATDEELRSILEGLENN